MTPMLSAASKRRRIDTETQSEAGNTSDLVSIDAEFIASYKLLEI
jgi:hypothetical protein